ncbi:MAG: class I SAM-dependent methyltransferase [Candidatus Paceibacterota bacterium]
MFSDPVKNLKQFGLGENMIVADLGAGTGFYSILAAKMVPHGKVYAIEIQKDFLGIVKNKIKDANIKNIDCFLGNIEKIGGTLLASDIIDAVIVSNVLSQIENKDKFIEEIKRILKDSGKVLLVDWSDISNINSNLKKIIPKETAREIFESNGLVFDREINAGAHHYGMIFTR